MTTQTAPALFDPIDRDPREYSYGLFVSDTPAQGGAAGFTWFQDDAEALAYLARQLPALYLDGDDLREATEEIANTLKGATELSSLDLSPLNTTLSGLCEIRWAGTFFDLEGGSKPFEREIQGDYHSNVFCDDRVDDLSNLDYLAAHLEHYNS